SCEVSAYVSPDFSRQGQARQLYTALFTLLRRQNLVMAYAGITQPNEPSVGFHESMGFEHVGTYKNVGYKHGTWRDVSWWGKQLQTPAIPHDDPIKFSDLPSEFKIPN
ncbi:MAG: N-acetyltransferase family protein, partial [Pseudomonadota bacterium]